MKPTTLYIVRHGQTTWNLEGRLQGHFDAPLTTLGRTQAAHACDKLKGIKLSAAFASPLGRAMETARILIGKRKMTITAVEGLKEVGLGLLEGMSRAEAEKAHFAQYHNFWERPHLFQLDGAESFADVQARTLGAIYDIAEAHTGEHVLIVSHGMAIKTILASFLGKELPALNEIELPANGSILTLQGSGDDLRHTHPPKPAHSHSPAKTKNLRWQNHRKHS